MRHISMTENLICYQWGHYTYTPEYSKTMKTNISFLMIEKRKNKVKKKEKKKFFN